MNRKFIVCLIALFYTISSSAYDFEKDGIYYNKTGPNTVEVTHDGDFTDGTQIYIKAVIIPATVTNGETKYNVTALGEYAFYGCKNLISITIPNSVTKIKEHAFDVCTNLTEITVHWLVPLDVSAEVISGIKPGSISLIVPAGTETLYQAAAGWKYFGSIKGNVVGNIPVDRETIYYSAGILTVNTRLSEQIDIYSTGGALLYRAWKSTGEATFPVSHLPNGVWIIRGNSGWVKKFVK
ncbi:MAG: leucine-rich repeat domain-containing protein [Tannerella sp.]|jgi:hypothetical protein|nr:leucine-rich repeat domain-containing protein [Tannerella sp.]